METLRNVRMITGGVYQVHLSILMSGRLVQAVVVQEWLDEIPFPHMT